MKVGFEEGSHMILNYLQSFVDVESNWYFKKENSLESSCYLVMPGDEERGKRSLQLSFSKKSLSDLLADSLRHQGYWVNHVQMKEKENTIFYEVTGMATYESKGKVKLIR